MVEKKYAKIGRIERQNKLVYDGKSDKLDCIRI